ncbi:MAG: DUF262 domain-containing protein [Bacteroidales bacterium]|nr:DUF262 domain-containing protein [Bacteroidales bacterium]
MIKSNDIPIVDILKNIDNGTIQLPDFQRGWVWEDNRIRALIASISNAYPIGAAMFLDATGNNVHFKSRLFEGVDKNYSSVSPKTLVLDGQQRTTSIYRSMYSKEVVNTVDFKKKPILRFYYLDIPKCLDTLTDRIEAVISVPEDRVIRENIGRDVKLDLSSPEKEYENHCFPLNIIFDSNATMQWMMNYLDFHNQSVEARDLWKEFFSRILTTISKYQIPVIELGSDVPKEAVCQVFENVNQGGVSLTVFELVTATFAADNFELRKDWDSIWNELKKEKVMLFKNNQPAFTGTDFLTAITLLNSYKLWQASKRGGVSCKKRDVLQLQYKEYIDNKDALVDGITEAIKFVKEQCIYTSVDLPYTSQLIPLAVTFAIDKNLWFNAKNKAKLTQWYWCGVFGELYGGANETRYVTDVLGLARWAQDDNALPDTVERSNFFATRLNQLTTRNSAAYKGVMALILKNHCKDFISGSEMDFASYVGEATDIHHIFPANYCEQQKYDIKQWNSVINKTPIYARTNRIIGGSAPSKYLSSIERNHGVSSDDLNSYLESHMINVDAIRQDDFVTYFKKRTESLYDLIEKATGKAVAGRDTVTTESNDDTSIDEQEIFI